MTGPPPTVGDVEKQLTEAVYEMGKLAELVTKLSLRVLFLEGMDSRFKALEAKNMQLWKDLETLAHAASSGLPSTGGYLYTELDLKDIQERMLARGVSKDSPSWVKAHGK